MQTFIVVRNDKSSTKVVAGFRDAIAAEGRLRELREERNRLLVWFSDVELARTESMLLMPRWSLNGSRLLAVRVHPGPLTRESVHAECESKMRALDRAHERKPIKDLVEVSWRTEECEIEDARD